MDVVLDKAVVQEGAVVMSSAYVMDALVRYQLICSLWFNEIVHTISKKYQSVIYFHQCILYPLGRSTCQWTDIILACCQPICSLLMYLAEYHNLKTSLKITKSNQTLESRRSCNWQLSSDNSTPLCANKTNNTDKTKPLQNKRQ